MLLVMSTISDINKRQPSFCCW